ncbi:MAG TPA: TfoX/Sxy family protein [Sulfuricaulis sp.]|nr:TfoX/Sxy family protein [Sulfuricaulis sp.]
MPRSREFVEFVIEQMAPFGRVRARAMFGGFGIYRDERIFAIIVDDRLYFKTDAATRGEFEARGLGPFTYVMRGKPVTMPYFEAPPEVFEEPDTMQHWAQMAYAAAGRTPKAKPPGKTRRRRAKPKK